MKLWIFDSLVKDFEHIVFPYWFYKNNPYEVYTSVFECPDMEEVIDGLLDPLNHSKDTYEELPN